MTRHVKVAILGAGSAGLYALSQVKRKTDSYLLIDGGELGTTCARVGCMPSKAMIQIAEDFHRRALFDREGIEGREHLSLNIADALEHVQDLRDVFVDKVLSSSTDQMGDEFMPANARFIAPSLLDVDGEEVHADKIIIATGSTPVVPEPWWQFGDRIVTTNDFFELESLPESMAVVGLGVIGLELGQALHRFGVDITGIDQLTTLARLSDDAVNEAAIEIMGKSFPLWLGHEAGITQEADGRLTVAAGDKSVTVDKVLVSIGRRPNLQALCLDKAGIDAGPDGIPDYDPHTMQIKGHPVFLAGDVNADRPLLHEAGDEGRIAGYNAVASQPVRFKRKTPLSITFTDPNIVTVGHLPDSNSEPDVISASVKFGPLGRALIMGKNRGLLRLHARKHDGALLAAAMIAPHGEHLGHLLAWSIEQQLSVLQMLQMPFYHPVIEEALQPALRELLAASDLKPEYPAELEPLLWAERAI